MGEWRVLDLGCGSGISMYIYMYVCMYVCMYVYLCIYICMYIYIHVHIYVCTYIYMYIYIRIHLLPLYNLNLYKLTSSLGLCGKVFQDFVVSKSITDDKNPTIIKNEKENEKNENEKFKKYELDVLNTVKLQCGGFMVGVDVCMYIDVYIYIYTCIHVYIYACMYIYTYIYNIHSYMNIYV
jgi:hypothetical protein